MADFTLDERARIRSLLGWEARFLQYDSRLESALDAIDQNSPADQTLIRSLLTQLTALDVRITASQSRFGVERVGSIWLKSDYTIGLLKSEGKRLVGTIAAILGVEIKRNFYGGGGPVGGVRQYG